MMRKDPVKVKKDTSKKIQIDPVAMKSKNEAKIE